MAFPDTVMIINLLPTVAWGGLPGVFRWVGSICEDSSRVLQGWEEDDAPQSCNHAWSSNHWWEFTFLEVGCVWYDFNSQPNHLWSLFTIFLLCRLWSHSLARGSARTHWRNSSGVRDKEEAPMIIPMPESLSRTPKLCGLSTRSVRILLEETVVGAWREA